MTHLHVETVDRDGMDRSMIRRDGFSNLFWSPFSSCVWSLAFPDAFILISSLCNLLALGAFKDRSCWIEELRGYLGHDGKHRRHEQASENVPDGMTGRHGDDDDVVVCVCVSVSWVPSVVQLPTFLAARPCYQFSRRPSHCRDPC